MPLAARRQKEIRRKNRYFDSANVVSRSSSAIRSRALALSAAASRAIDVSPARSIRGTRRSRAAISSSRSRTIRFCFTAISAGRTVAAATSTHSRSRRNSCTASSCRRPESSRSSRLRPIGKPDTTPVSRERALSLNFSRALLRGALVRAGGQNGRRAQESRRDASSIRHSLFPEANTPSGGFDQDGNPGQLVSRRGYDPLGGLVPSERRS